MRLARPLGFCLAILVATAPSARAQAPDVLPYPLARALASGWLDNVVVGALPPGWPAELVPPAPTYVLGGTGRRPSMTAVFADSTISPLGAFQQRLEAAGFRRRTSQWPYADGFISSASGGDESYCRDSLRVSPVVVRDGGAPYLLRVSVSGYGGECGERPSHAPRTAALRIPPLSPPPGVTLSHSNGGSGSNSVSSQAVLTDTANTAQTLVSHFARQLSAAGWTVAPPVADRRVAAAALEARDSTGVTWHGVLLVFTQAGQHNASVNMNAPRER